MLFSSIFSWSCWPHPHDVMAICPHERDRVQLASCENIAKLPGYNTLSNGSNTSGSDNQPIRAVNSPVNKPLIRLRALWLLDLMQRHKIRQNCGRVDC